MKIIALKSVFHYFFLLFISCSIQGQVSILFQDSLSKIPVEEVFVQLYTSGQFDEIFDVQVTTDEGLLKINESQDTLFFLATHLQYKAVQKAIPVLECTPCVVDLITSRFTLSEVEVTAKDRGVRVLGDTIRFDLSVFRNKSQKDLQDLIHALPGVEVKSDGQILYNNKRIDKILLSGEDVLKSQFDMLNRLVRKDMVETIQIVPGKLSDGSEEQPQYMDIVLSQEHRILATVGVGVSHIQRWEQDASMLSTGNRPLQYFVNVVNRSLDKSALSSGDRLRKEDFEMLETRAKLLKKPPIFQNVSDDNKDGVDYGDLFVQANAQLKRGNYQATAYVDYRNRSFEVSNFSQNNNPLTGQLLEVNHQNLQSSISSISTYFKQVIDIKSKHKIKTYLACNWNTDSPIREGNSLFLGESSDFKTHLFNRSKDIVYYHVYTYQMNDKVTFELENDISYIISDKDSKLNSSTDIFGFTVMEGERFAIEHQQDRASSSVIIRPKLNYIIDTIQQISVYTQHTRVGLEDKSILLQENENDVFNTDYSRRFVNSELGIMYRIIKDRFQLVVQPHYTLVKNREPSKTRDTAYGFFIKLRYDFTHYLSLINTVGRSLQLFADEELFTSVDIVDNRNYSFYANIDSPTFLEWSASSALRYINTANAKVFLLTLNTANRSKSLVPKVEIVNTSQQTTYVEGDAVRQLHIQAFTNIPLLGGNTTSRFDIFATNSFVSNGVVTERLFTRQYNFYMSYNTSVAQHTQLNTRFGVNHLSQYTGELKSDFTTIVPMIKVQQFVQPKFWFTVTYQPLIRLELENQHQLDFSVLTKFFKEKLTLKMSFVDVLNFNNPTYTSRSITPNIVRQSMTTRIGGYVLLNIGYQF